MTATNDPPLTDAQRREVDNLRNRANDLQWQAAEEEADGKLDVATERRMCAAAARNRANEVLARLRKLHNRAAVSGACAIALLVAIVLGVPSCNQPPLDQAQQSGNAMAQAGGEIGRAARAGHAATTQVAAAVNAAHDAINKPTPDVPKANEQLGIASAGLQQINGQWVYVIERVKTIEVESPKLQQALVDAKKQYNDLKDWWPVRFALWCKAAFWTLVWLSAGLAALLALLSAFGVQKITSPVLGFAGGILSAIGVAAYHLSMVVWSAIPLGTWLDELFHWLGGVLHLKPAAAAVAPAVAPQPQVSSSPQPKPSVPAPGPAQPASSGVSATAAASA